MKFKSGKRLRNFLTKDYWNKTRRFFAFVTLLSFAGLLLSIFSFRIGVDQIHMDHLQDSIQSTAKSSLAYSNHLINEMVGDLEGVTIAVNEYEDFHHPDVIKILQYTNQTSHFSYIGLADPQGNGYDSHGNVINISDRSYFQTAMKSQVAFSDVMNSKVFPDEKVQIIAHPIRSTENVVRGVVYGVLHINEIEQLGIQHEANRQASIYIVDSCGAYIAQLRDNHMVLSSGNFWSDMENSSLNSEELAQLKSDFYDRKEGGISYSYGETDRYACYMPLGPNRWQLVYSVSTSAAEDIVHELYLLDTKEAISAATCYIILLLCIIWYFRRTNAEIKKAHQDVTSSLEYMRFAIDHSKHIFFEYDQTHQSIQLKNSARNRLFQHAMMISAPGSLVSENVIAPDSVPVFKKLFEDIKTERSTEADIQILNKGEPIWYRISMSNIYNEQNEILVTVGIVEDISNQKKREAEIQKKILVQKTLIANALVYGVIDLNTATILEWNEEEVNLPYQETARQKILETVSDEHISYVEQQLSLESLRDAYQRGEDTVEVQYRKKFGDKLKWVSVVIYRMHMDNTSKVLLVLSDIEKQKQRELYLKKQAEQDGLTGLYNAVTTRDKINEVLSLPHQSSEAQVFALMDLDNYKQINDTFGHSYGDQVLIDIANVLNNRSRSSDIVGRIGGDEFVILLRDMKDHEYVENLIEELCKSIHRTYRDGNQEVTISASIGLAAAPRDGTTFQELYKKADIAQYHVKKHCKNGFEWYR